MNGPFKWHRRPWLHWGSKRRASGTSDFDHALGVIGHELRTPIHGVLGLARLMRDELQILPAPSQLLSRLRLLEQAGDRLLALVEDALDLADAEFAASSAVLQPFDLAPIVAAISQAASAAAADKGLRYALAAILPAPCWVIGDGRRLGRALRRLADDAIRSTDLGAVSLAVHADGLRNLRFEVTATGRAAADIDTARLFAAVDAADAAVAIRHGSAGVRLAACSALIRSMGGTLSHRLTADGGSAFSFSLALPLVPADAAQALALAAGQHGATPGTAPSRILLVEDDALSAIIATEMLSMAKVNVDLATDGAAAVELAATRRYDLILMDCQLPVMDGCEATRRIRERERAAGNSPAPIVALTANASQAERRRTREAGMNDHVAKPFSQADMAMLLHCFLFRQPHL